MITLLIYCCMILSGRISREEEARELLKRLEGERNYEMGRIEQNT